MEGQTEPRDGRQLREHEVSLAIIFRVHLKDVEEVEARLENLLGGRIVFSKFSPGKLWIWDRDPREARP